MVAKLGNIFRTQKLCPRSKNLFEFRRKHFFVSEQQNLFPQHTVGPRYNKPRYNEDSVITKNVRKPGRITVKYGETNPAITNPAIMKSRGVLSYMGYMVMCGPKGYGFSAVLVINRVSILADFGHK